MKKKKSTKPLVLIVLDGWGVSQPYTGNAISQADTLAIDDFTSKYPTMTIRASGEAVGLPWGESGNSEVGHLNLGLGRIVYQDLPKINKLISDHSFEKNNVLLGAIEHAKKNNSSLHLMGLCSDGCVHASIDHMYALIDMAIDYGIEDLYVHAFLDGRDVPLDSGLNFVRKIEEYLSDKGVGKIATLAGRFYAMDRNNNWDRTALAYKAMVEGKGARFASSVKAIEASYANKVFDEELEPIVIEKNNQPLAKISDNDSVVFFNFRPDRARQISKAFVLPEMEKFERGERLRNLFFVAFTEYEKGLPFGVAFPKDKNFNCLGKVISDAGLKQLRISETEKYAHVTYFFNGGVETKNKGEDHVLVPSKPVPSYDQVPEMSAPEICSKVLEAVSDEVYDFILINFANADMVGHTGNLEAAKEAIKTIDNSVERIVNAVLSKNGVVMITADHGNAENMFNMQSGQIDKEHSANPVPFILIGNDFAGRSIGWIDAVSDDLSTAQPQGILADVAPTVLDLLGIDQPEEMTGVSLLADSE